MKIKLNLSVKLLIILIGILSLSFKDSKAYMFWNQACEFAGNSESYISIPNSTTINITSNFTIESWVNPFSISGTKAILSKGGVQGASQNYSLKLLSGRVILTTNGIERIRSKTSSALKPNEWTHVAVTYLSITRLFSIYINGVLDTSAVYESATPVSNSDSLFIGAAGQFISFSGQLDEVRIWKKALSNIEVGRYFRTSLGVSSGIYNLMTLSFTFQKNHSSGSSFSLYDWSENSNTGYGRNISAVDLSDRPYNTVFPNECIELDGTGDYVENIDSLDFRSNSTNGLSMQCWIYPRQNTAATIIYSTNLSTSDFALYINPSGYLEAIVDNVIFNSGTASKIPINKWSHVAFNYRNLFSSGAGTFFLNGNPIGSDTNSLTVVNFDSHILYIGGGPGLNDFNGFIDEVSITQLGIGQSTILEKMNITNDKSNISAGGFGFLGFSFDGILKDNVEAINGGMRLKFVGNARFSHPGTITDRPVSPVVRSDDLNFAKGFYIKRADKRIPSSGNSGVITDSLPVNASVSINDLNFFVAMNHTNLQDISITLRGPNGDSVTVFNSKTNIGENNNLITIFEDNADSLLKNNTYTAFSPSIKGENNLNSVFGSDNSQGYWRITIKDNGSSDTGRLYAWGVQINNMNRRELNLDLSAVIQGFYSESSSSMISDSLRVYLWLAENFSLRDSSVALLNSNGTGLFSFEGLMIGSGVPYYIQLKHRNAIETWSNFQAFPLYFIGGEATYDFRTHHSKAFGSNMIAVDVTPLRYALYNGDVNQDGTIDLTDGSLIDNDAFNFASGYLPTDLNGDGIIDIADAVIADNNAANFVSAVTP